MKVKPTGTGINIRTGKTLESSTNIIGRTTSVTPVEAVDVGDFYELKTYLHKSVAVVIPEPVEPDGSIPYISQWDNEANQRGSDCGQTAVAMVARWMGVMIAVNDLKFQVSANGLSNSTNLIDCFAQCNINAIAVKYPYELQEGDICLVQYSGFERDNVQDKGYLGGHWVVFIEDNDDFVTVHDPDWWGARRLEGAFKTYSKTEWDKAYGYYNQIVRTV